MAVWAMRGAGGEVGFSEGREVFSLVYSVFSIGKSAP